MNRLFPDADSFDLLVAGAGPAGLLAALTAAGAGSRVLLAERGRRFGGKLIHSGGGRCNLSNTLDSERFMAGFGRHGRTMQAALRNLDSAGLRRLLDTLGVPTFTPDGVRVYPTGEAATDVVQALIRGAADAGVHLISDAEVTEIRTGHGRVTGAVIRERELATAAVVIAGGGRAYPQFGGTDCGYRLAQMCGHTIRGPVPALVPLVTKAAGARRLAGVRVPDVSVQVRAGRGTRNRTRGDLLFTHRGVSGPVILDLSGTVAEILDASGQAELDIDLTPDCSMAAWSERVQGWRQDAGRRQVRRLLAAHLPTSLAAQLCDAAGIAGDTTAAQLRDVAARALIAGLKHWRLLVTGTEGWERAMVSRGGVPVREVEPGSLGSRLVSGLFFAGEVLDLDGPCGGFNLQWAFSSGCLAGLSAARLAAACPQSRNRGTA